MGGCFMDACVGIFELGTSQDIATANHDCNLATSLMCPLNLFGNMHHFRHFNTAFSGCHKTLARELQHDATKPLRGAPCFRSLCSNAGAHVRVLCLVVSRVTSLHIFPTLVGHVDGCLLLFSGQHLQRAVMRYGAVIRYSCFWPHRFGCNKRLLLPLQHHALSRENPWRDYSRPSSQCTNCLTSMLF